jgi:hypothetical protein
MTVLQALKYVDRVTHAFGRIIIYISRVEKLCGECGKTVWRVWKNCVESVEISLVI